MAKRNDTVKAGEQTDVKVVPFTVDDLSKEYVLIESGTNKIECPSKWQWAKKVSEMLACTADKSEVTRKSEELAAKIGMELRGKPYSGSWVRLHTMAYRKFPNGLGDPLTDPMFPENARTFKNILTGNTSREAKKEQAKEQNEQAEKAEKTDDEKAQTDYLRLVEQAVYNAIRAGIPVTDVESAVKNAITKGVKSLGK